MKAVLSKIAQLFTFEQTILDYCKSSYGHIHLFLKNGCFIPDYIFNAYQTKKYHAPPIHTICTWNIQELWWHSYSGYKINNILRYILTSSFDVLCLQEVFDPYVLNTILSHPNIQTKYPYFITGNMRSKFIVGENSGLLVLSSHPILFKQFTPFTHHIFPDSFASKGALYFVIGEINFILTHLQSNNISIAAHQLEHILQNSPFTEKTILLGDLNIPDPYSILNLPRGIKHHTHESGLPLDHIISLQNDIQLSSIDVDYINIKNTSDHWPVVAKLG